MLDNYNSGDSHVKIEVQKELAQMVEEGDWRKLGEYLDLSSTYIDLPSVMDKQGRSLLHIACVKGSLHCCEVLLNYVNSKLKHQAVLTEA